jgi:hypothetical protein
LLFLSKKAFIPWAKSFFFQKWPTHYIFPELLYSLVYLYKFSINIPTNPIFTPAYIFHPSISKFILRILKLSIFKINKIYYNNYSIFDLYFVEFNSASNYDNFLCYHSELNFFFSNLPPSFFQLNFPAHSKLSHSPFSNSHK